MREDVAKLFWARSSPEADSRSLLYPSCNLCCASCATNVAASIPKDDPCAENHAPRRPNLPSLNQRLGSRRAQPAPCKAKCASCSKQTAPMQQRYSGVRAALCPETTTRLPEPAPPRPLASSSLPLSPSTLRINRIAAFVILVASRLPNPVNSAGTCSRNKPDVIQKLKTQTQTE